MLLEKCLLGAGTFESPHRRNILVLTSDCVRRVEKVHLRFSLFHRSRKDARMFFGSLELSTSTQKLRAGSDASKGHSP